MTECRHPTLIRTNKPPERIDRKPLYQYFCPACAEIRYLRTDQPRWDNPDAK